MDGHNSNNSAPEDGVQYSHRVVAIGRVRGLIRQMVALTLPASLCRAQRDKSRWKCTKLGWLGSPMSSEMSPFDRAHTTSYSTLIETMHRPISCTVFEIWRVICRNSPTLSYPTSIWRPRWGWPRSNFGKIFGIRKLESLHGLSCGVVCVILSVAVLIQYRLVTDGQTDGRTETQTHDDS